MAALEPKRHVSRWHALPAAHGDDATDADAAAAAAVREPEVSLRYLNEFVGKLQCAPALLEHKLYPDAKEITESMGVFNAVRKYVLQDEHESASTMRDASDKADGIVVVGDGSTPRTAAMFAHRLRHWKSFSIDPAMEFRSSERSRGWETITNLVVVRNKIENVRITLRRAIVVLVHAHVTLAQALSAVVADHIVAVVTLPCCNWFREHESLFGRPPDLVYDDYSVLSDKREVRLWVNSNSDNSSDASPVIASTEATVCVRKTFRADGVRADDIVNSDLAAEASDDDSMAVSAAATIAKRVHVLEIFKRSLAASAAGELAEQQQVATAGRELPVELLARLESPQHVLVLDTDASRTAARSLLLRGRTTRVYVLGAPQHDDVGGGTSVDRIDALRVPLIQLTLADSSNSASQQLIERHEGWLQIAVCAANGSHEPIGNDDDDPAGASSFDVTFDAADAQFAGLDCVVDHRFVYCGFRGESRNAPLFRQLCVLVYRIAAATTTIYSRTTGPTMLDGPKMASMQPLLLVCVTPRKNWRKKEFLSHEALQFEIESVAVPPRARVASWALADRAQRDDALTFVFCCQRIHRSAVDRVLAAEALAHHTAARDAVLALQQALTRDATAVRQALAAAGTRVLSDLSVPQVLALAPQAAEIDARIVADRTYVDVVAQITNVRRYSKGMAFVSLAPVGSSTDANGAVVVDEARNMPSAPLQAFLQLHELAWSPAHYHDVLQLLHPGDDVRVLGFCKKSDRGTPLLAVAAIELVRGEFVAYN